jgi:hypothetical protein
MNLIVSTSTEIDLYHIASPQNLNHSLAAVGFSAVVMYINYFFDTSIPAARGLQLFNTANKMLEAFFAVNIVTNVVVTALIGMWLL